METPTTTQQSNETNFISTMMKTMNCGIQSTKIIVDSIKKSEELVSNQKSIITLVFEKLETINYELNESNNETINHEENDVIITKYLDQYSCDRLQNEILDMHNEISKISSEIKIIQQIEHLNNTWHSTIISDGIIKSMNVLICQKIFANFIVNYLYQQIKNRALSIDYTLNDFEAFEYLILYMSQLVIANTATDYQSLLLRFTSIVTRLTQRGIFSDEKFNEYFITKQLLLKKINTLNEYITTLTNQKYQSLSTSTLCDIVTNSITNETIDKSQIIDFVELLLNKFNGYLRIINDNCVTNNIIQYDFSRKIGTERKI